MGRVAGGWGTEVTVFPLPSSDDRAVLQERASLPSDQPPPAEVPVPLHPLSRHPHHCTQCQEVRPSPAYDTTPPVVHVVMKLITGLTNHRVRHRVTLSFSLPLTVMSPSWCLRLLSLQVVWTADRSNRHLLTLVTSCSPYTGVHVHVYLSDGYPSNEKFSDIGWLDEQTGHKL